MQHIYRNSRRDWKLGSPREASHDEANCADHDTRDVEALLAFQQHMIVDNPLDAGVRHVADGAELRL